MSTSNTDDETDVVATWPDHQRNAVGIQLPGLPKRYVEPDDARQLADDVEDNCLDDLMDPTTETRELVDDLRHHADEVEDNE